MDKYTQELLDAAREALAQQELEERVEHTLKTRAKFCAHSGHFYCREQPLSHSVLGEHWAASACRPDTFWTNQKEAKMTRH